MMKDFSRLVLCEYYSDRVDIHVRASCVNGKLMISGQDLGPSVEEFWGDLDYEYWYSLDKEGTGRLMAAIHGEDEPEAALVREFSGEDGCAVFRKVCEENGITYHFNSYV